MSESLLRLRRVIARTGKSRSAIYAGMALGTFPSPISIGARSVGWIESEIDTWIVERIAESRR
jgi:prophage regulatory protein